MSLEDRNKMRELIMRYNETGAEQDYQKALQFAQSKGEDVQCYIEMLEMTRLGVEGAAEV